MPEFKSAIPVLPASDIERSAAFYEQALGMRVRFRNDSYAVLARDSVELHLWAAMDQTWKDRSAMPPVVSGAESFIAGTASCRIMAGDIDRLYEEMKATGIVHPNGHLEAKWYGLREFAILDPDKNLVSFYADPAADASST